MAPLLQNFATILTLIVIPVFERSSL